MFYIELKKIIKTQLNEYPRYDKIIEDLENDKEGNISRDINSYIRSQNRVNKPTESIAIHEITNDNLISQYKEWKKIIDEVMEDFYKNDPIKADIVEYKFFRGYREDRILDIVFISKTSLENQLKNIYFEFGIKACLNGLIKFDKKLKMC